MALGKAWYESLYVDLSLARRKELREEDKYKIAETERNETSELYPSLN